MKTLRFTIGEHKVLIKLQDNPGANETDFKAGDSDSEADEAYDHAIDGIESLILAHPCARMDVQSSKYVAGLEVALESRANQFL